jgi:hypothetical protein
MLPYRNGSNSRHLLAIEHGQDERYPGKPKTAGCAWDLVLDRYNMREENEIPCSRPRMTAYGKSYEGQVARHKVHGLDAGKTGEAEIYERCNVLTNIISGELWKSWRQHRTPYGKCIKRRVAGCGIHRLEVGKAGKPKSTSRAWELGSTDII